MTAVVTGANGFLGSVLVRMLLAQGRRVRAVVRSSSRGLEGLNVEIVKADVRDLDDLRHAFTGAESVFHLAAVISLTGDQGGRVTETNVGGARNAAIAALETGVRRYIHCSSIHAFDLTNTTLLIDETTPGVGNDHPIYDRTKAMGETVVRQVLKDGLPGIIINPSGVIGPGDHQPSRIGQVLLDLQERKFPALIPGGFNWVDVRDVCMGAINAEQHGHVGENYILSGWWHSTRQLASFGQEVTGIAPPRIDVPMWLARGLAGFWKGWPWASHSKLGDVGSQIWRPNADAISALRGARDVSHAKAARDLGYNPRPIRESVHDAYRWFEQAHMLKSPHRPLREQSHD